MKKSSPQFKKITSKSELYEAIDFIRKGYNLSENFFSGVYDSLCKNKNNNVGFYGFTMNTRENKMIGAILAISQGNINIKGTEYQLINTSSWFVNKHHRGYKSILMVKYISRELSNSIISNFSSNRYSETIFKALGYKKCITCTTNFFITQYLYFAILKMKWHKYIKLDFSDIKYPPIEKGNRHNTLRDSFYLDIKAIDNHLRLLLTLTKVEKIIIGIRFTIPRVNIIWCSNNQILSKSLIQIMGFLMFRYRSPIVSCHCLTLSERVIKKIWRYHFYKAPIEINSILPITGSEYSIGSKN